MSTIIPLSISSSNVASSGVTESKAANGNEENGMLEKETGRRVMDEFVDFLLKKGDKEMIDNFQHCLSDFSRHKEHIFDSQLERIDKWQSRENHRNDEFCDVIEGILKEPKYVVLRDLIEVHDNKIGN